MTVESLPVPRGFSFDLTVRSHGWFDLPPFRFDRATRTLDVPLERGGGQAPVVASVRAGSSRALRVEWHGSGDPGPARDTLRSVLRLGEDLGPFHRHVANDPERRWIATRGAGRLLRAPTAFEDLVKLVLTTNCSWALTKKMTAALVDACGEPAPLGLKTFPGASRLARRDAAFFRDRVRAGYRSPFLADLARRVASGAVDPESWRDPSTSTDEIRKQVLEVPGAGPYVAENLLKLLGRYDYLALDSWCRARYAALFSRGRKVSDRTIERRYRAHGPWRGLVMWLDLTRSWHEEPGDPIWS